jgi:hypothetical protein
MRWWAGNQLARSRCNLSAVLSQLSAWSHVPNGTSPIVSKENGFQTVSMAHSLAFARYCMLVASEYGVEF